MINDDCISREAVIEHICKSKECYKDECKGRLYKRCSSLQWVYDLPPVTPKKETAIRKFNEFYDKAVKLSYVEKPISWALYQTWKWFDGNEKSRKAESEEE